jgi:hypothetical protein
MYFGGLFDTLLDVSPVVDIAVFFDCSSTSSSSPSSGVDSESFIFRVYYFCVQFGYLLIV